MKLPSSLVHWFTSCNSGIASLVMRTSERVNKEQVNNWFFRKSPPHALAIFRIAFGIFLAVYALTYVWHIPLLFSSEGFVFPLFSDLSIPALQWLINPPPPVVAYCIALLLFVAITLFTIGWHFRLATGVLILLGIYYWQLQLHMFPTSYNRLFFFLLIVLFFSGADATFSLRQKLQKCSWNAAHSISILPQRLITLQVMFTYWGVGWQKVVLDAWQGGEILYYSFQGMWATPLAWWLIGFGLPMLAYDVLVYVVTWFEVLLPFGLWPRKTRLWFIAGAILFHLGVAIFLSIWWFVALYATYHLFWEPEEIEKIFN